MISGSYYDGVTSKPHSCELSVDAQGGVLLVGIEHQVYKFDELEISSRVGNTVRAIRFADKSRFETQANDAVDALIKKHSEPKGSWMNLHVWESKLKLIVLSTIVTAFLLVGFITVGLPAASKMVAHKLPYYLTNTLAQEAFEELEAHSFEKSELSAERQTQLTELLLAHVPEGSDFNYQLLFRKSDRFGANALALPNGIIIFTDDLVKLADNDEELLSVLLHEIGHIEHRHSLRNIVEATGLYVMYSWLSGDVEVSSVAILAASGWLLKARYSRGHESEADEYCLNTLLESGINPNYFANIMHKLNESKKIKRTKKSDAETESEVPEDEIKKNDEESGIKIVLDYLSSHPSSEQRIETFKAAAKRNGYAEL